jgi:hypothetical protein
VLCSVRLWSADAHYKCILQSLMSISATTTRVLKNDWWTYWEEIYIVLWFHQEGTKYILKSQIHRLFFWHDFYWSKDIYLVNIIYWIPIHATPHFHFQILYCTSYDLTSYFFPPLSREEIQYGFHLKTYLFPLSRIRNAESNWFPSVSYRCLSAFPMRKSKIAVSIKSNSRGPLEYIRMASTALQ